MTPAFEATSSIPALARIAELSSRLGGRAGGVLGARVRAEVFAASLDRAMDGGPAVAAVPGRVVAAEAVALRRPAWSLVDGAAGPTVAALGIDWGDGAGTDRLPAGTPFAELFASAGERHDVPARLLAAVAQVESGFSTTAVSRAGALGVMQLMPATAAGLGVDPWDPASAIDGAARLLAGWTAQFGSVETGLAAYNAGPVTVRRHGGRVPPQTWDYVDKVLSYYRGVV